MSGLLRLRGTSPGGVVVYRVYNRIIFDREKASTYTTKSAARVGLGTARKNWPDYEWCAIDRAGNPVDVGECLQRTFTRDEVWALVLKERAACVALCDAVAHASQCAYDIITKRPKNLKDLECETKPSSP